MKINNDSYFKRTLITQPKSYLKLHCYLYLHEQCLTPGIVCVVLTSKKAWDLYETYIFSIP